MSASLTAHNTSAARKPRASGTSPLPAIACVGLIAGMSIGLWIGVARLAVLIAARF